MDHGTPALKAAGTLASYRASVDRDGRFWLVHVDGVGSTQARNLAELEAVAKDLVEVMVGDADADVSFEPPLGQLGAAKPEDVTARLNDVADSTDTSLPPPIDSAPRHLIDRGTWQWDERNVEEPPEQTRSRLLPAVSPSGRLRGSRPVPIVLGEPTNQQVLDAQREERL